MAQKNTKMLNGEDMFLSTTLLKLFGAINGNYEQSRFFFNEVAILRQITVLLWGIIEHKNDEIVSSTILLKHASTIRRVLYI